MISDRSLQITCYDVIRKRHRLIGQVVVPLKSVIADGQGEKNKVHWRDLLIEENKDASSTVGENLRSLVTSPGLARPEVLLSLSLNNLLQRMNIGVFEGRHLEEWSKHGEMYIKIVLMQNNRPVKTKKTSVSKKRKTVEEPNDENKKTKSFVFNESFSFSIDIQNIDTYSVSFHIMENYLANKDKQIGRVVLGSFMYARGRELEHWNEMISKPKEQVSFWHRLI